MKKEKKTSRIRLYSALEYPTKQLLENMLWDNTKGDYPVKIIQLKNRYEWKVIWRWY